MKIVVNNIGDSLSVRCGSRPTAIDSIVYMGELVSDTVGLYRAMFSDTARLGRLGTIALYTILSSFDYPRR